MRKNRHSNILSIFAILFLVLIIFRPQLVINTINSISNKFYSNVSQKSLYAQYDKKQVTGSMIATSQGTVYAFGINMYAKTLQDKDFIKYTKENPYNKADKNNCKFNSTVIKDKNKKVIGIKFEEVASK